MRDIINLIEGRDAYLYHGTDLARAVSILRDNEIYGTTEKEHLPFAVSTTRDPGFAYEAGTWFDKEHPVIFVLDQRKIAQRFRITPHSDKNADDEAWEGSNTRGIEAEERVVGSLKPLDPYLVSINVDPDFIARARRRIRDWVGKEDENYGGLPLYDTRKVALAALDALAHHPKLNAVRLPAYVDRKNQAYRRDNGIRRRRS